jgi:hypothetical protein
MGEPVVPQGAQPEVEDKWLTMRTPDGRLVRISPESEGAALSRKWVVVRRPARPVDRRRSR